MANPAMDKGASPPKRSHRPRAPRGSQCMSTPKLEAVRSHRSPARSPTATEHLPLGSRGPRSRGALRDRDGTGDRRRLGASRGRRTGPVGFAWGALRILRYEVRCWSDGITAYEYAVEGPLRLTHDASMATRLLELARDVLTPVWGRDELGAGEMWTCNSLTSWLLGRTNLCESIRPPLGGRGPGWDAGLRVARRGPDLR